jgi:uncharacterized protein (TIGR02466 family)
MTIMIDDYESINERLLKKFNSISDNEKIMKTYGWQTGLDIHKTWPEMQDLRVQLDQAIVNLQTHLNFHVDARLSTAWGQMYTYKERMEKHTHPNCFYSGTYYIKSQPGSGRINFHDTRPNNGVITYPLTAPNEYSGGMFSLDPTPGMLVLFPSWSPHSVDANADDDTRVSLAFNWVKPLHEEGITSA